MSNDLTTNNAFINPYTFVPLSKKGIKTAQDKGLIGIIECSLTIDPEHPLFIPNTTCRFEYPEPTKKPAEEKHWFYDFYSYENLENAKPVGGCQWDEENAPKNPVIPGSEIRGMIRNIYEQLTGSCMPVVNETSSLFNRSLIAKKPSLLKPQNNGTYTFGDILKKQGESSFNPCKTEAECCPACDLFGMSGDESFAGRLRFCDTALNGNPEFVKAVTLPILGTPKITAAEFYMKKPTEKAKYWNYEYYYEQYENKKENKPEIFKSFDKNNPAQLSGRKVYWLGKYNLKDIKVEPTIQNCTVRPLKNGSFKFKIYFDGISNEELADLLFCLDFEDAKDGAMRHRIGKGKPIGMGAVKVNVDKITQRTYNYKDGVIVPLDSSLPRSEHVSMRDAKKDIFAYAVPLPENEAALVAYPTLSDVNKIFEWFANNRGNINKPEYKDTLSELHGDKTLKKDPSPNTRR